MSREKQFDKTAYDIAYIKANIVTKRINFNRQQPEDMKLLTWLESHENITQYLKGLILRDLEARESRE